MMHTWASNEGPRIPWYSRSCSVATLMHVPDNPVCALAELLGHSIPLIDYEVLIEDLEDLAPLEVRHSGNIQFRVSTGTRASLCSKEGDDCVWASKQSQDFRGVGDKRKCGAQLLVNRTTKSAQRA